MIYIKFIFWLPSILLQWGSLLLPFNGKAYRPSTHTEQEISQHLRNSARLAAYKMKRKMK